jgi:hypothetical protein
MIGFNHLGRHGRLANQMFQYSALRGICALKGYKFCIPESEFRDQWNDHQLFQVFELPNLKNVKLLSGDYYQERQYNYDSEYVLNCPDNVNLYGYFQSEKYFKHIEKSIREDFTFKPEILEPCEGAFDFNQLISLHVRRTDYVTSAVDHPPCSFEYYQKALEQYDNNIPVMIFSDDIAWCKEQKLFSSDRFLFSENDWNAIDLCLMSMCTHHIMANSSFSWWGAWLSGSNNVIAPEKWYGDSGYTAQNNTCDLIPNRWNKL